HHERGVQRVLDPVNGEAVVAGRQPEHAVDRPEDERNERDGADPFGQPMARAFLGRAQAAGAAERGAIADHQSAPVMPAMTQMARVAAAAKANTSTAEALAAFTSRPWPESQTRCRTPLAR